MLRLQKKKENLEKLTKFKCTDTIHIWGKNPTCYCGKHPLSRDQIRSGNRREFILLQQEHILAMNRGFFMKLSRLENKYKKSTKDLVDLLTDDLSFSILEKRINQEKI